MNKRGGMDIGDPELDPRLAAQYDIDNVWSADDDFFLALVKQRPLARVLDLGCGSGRLTTAIALEGHAVTGVDPNPAFLAIAHAKPGGQRVAWVRGTSVDVPSPSFDIALMTSHVAQELESDDEWAAVLADLKRALVPGGILSFDTRDPAARAWERWDIGEDHTELPDGSQLHSVMSMSYEPDEPDDGDGGVTGERGAQGADRRSGGGVARFEATMAITNDATPAGGESAGGPSPGVTWSRAQWCYRFRTPQAVRDSVTAAGFTVEAMFGGWHREPLGEGTGEIVVVARA